MTATARTNPAAPPPAESGSPVGAWSARVRRETETSAVVLHFTGDGRVFLSGGGAGHWEPAGPDGFTFRVAEPLFDERGPEAGDCVGWVDIDQLAVLDGDTFRSEGVSVVRDSAGGRVLRTKRVTVTARGRTRTTGSV
jgi:hypothetical protein